MRVLNIKESFGRIPDTWSPHVAGRVNGQEVRLARIEGAFDWHRHANADEAFFVVNGTFEMHFREGIEERVSTLGEGDFVVVPAGVEHRPVADQECWILLIAEADELNTGDVTSEKTKRELPEL